MLNNLNIISDKNVLKIISKLNKNGFEAFVVGGCVRDVILGKKPSDYDITTNALPSDIKKIFTKTFDTGIKHGTVSILLSNKTYEVTTYRIDGKYLDHRRPSDVKYTNNLKLDLSRRDFTINAMAYNVQSGLIDLFDGIKDIKSKLIRCVGEPKARFEEDSLRMLRAIRFSATLGFEIDNSILNAIKIIKDNLRYISIERINAEFVKLITSNNTDRLFYIFDLGLSKYLFNDLYYLDFKNDNKKIDSLFNLLDNSKSDIISRLSILFAYPYNIQDINNKTLNAKYDKNVKKILKYLKFDNKTINTVSKYVYYLKSPIITNEEDIRYQIRNIGKDNYNEFLYIKEVIIKNYYNDKYHDFLIQKKISNKIIKNNNPLTIKELKVNGNDIKMLNIKEKSDIGLVNNYLLKKVLYKPSNNKKNILLNLAKEYLDNEREKNEL